MNNIIPITVAYGDGIGPEIMESVLYIMQKAEAKIKVETIEIGSNLYNRNYAHGISQEVLESIANTRILLKAPTTTPQGKGHKSLNVALRKSLGLYANIRPCISYHPFIKTKYPEMDIVVIRENEEDLYTGIEYRHSRNMYESCKLVSRTGSERIIRHAFEYAILNNRKKVTCLTKDNIMKFSDGIFHKIFKEISNEYTQIESEHYIIDIGAAKIATNPSDFDVIVTTNLYGDIISDITAQLSGSVGLVGSACLGKDYAMFEAVSGSAPDIAGRDIANPSGLLWATIMMLTHIGDSESANLIENAWKRTIEDGIHTRDIYSKSSSQKVGTKDFTNAIIERLNKVPNSLRIANYSNSNKSIIDDIKINNSEKKELVGVDVFIDIHINSGHKIAEKIKKIDSKLKLQKILCKGLSVPLNKEFIIESDHWCCRFLGESISHSDIIDLITKITNLSFDFIKIENLYEFDKNKGYSIL